MMKVIPGRLNFFCLICIFICIETVSYADGGLYLFPKGAKATGMGKNGLLNIDVWSVYNNQAALAHIENISAGLHYENKFTANQLGISAGAVAVPALTGTFGLDIAHMGIDDYGETRVGAGYGKKLMKRLSIGIQFNYHLLNFTSGYPGFSTFTGEVGLLAEPLDNLFIGVHVFNPTFARLNSQYEDPVPVIFETGAGYVIAGKLMLTAEIEKARYGDMSPRFGIDYSLFKSMNLRAGVSLNPAEVCFGAGWTAKKKLVLDFSVYYHEILGYSPQISLSYCFGK
ncbi:MAG: hypothetical protein LBH60_08835 [Prevotellaceae bacterium]|jgi:hypothetical protein|nr:hypothetical protein [Prevotellaceae bacterium]